MTFSMFSALINMICIISIILIITSYLECSPLPKSNEDLIVSLPNGKIRGHILTSYNNNNYYAFQGIPYASPPIEELRFQEPTAPHNWTEILDTTQIRKICPQAKIVEDPLENEDCLYLNVFTPQLPSKNTILMPVLVYIYGGMFRAGTPTDYDFQMFVEQGIVAVCPNFRSGALSFLSTEDSVLPGNLGLKDQNFALHWVQQNIHLFGGDPNKVTIAGHSSGAAAVTLQVLSRRSEGLFRAAIAQSFSAISHDSLQKYPKYFAYELGKKFSSSFTSQNSSSDLLRLLKTVSARKIMTTNIQMAPFANSSLIGYENEYLIWKPSVENPNKKGSFITGHLHDDFKDGRFNKVQFLTGITSHEFVANFDQYAPYGAVFDSNSSFLVNQFHNVKEEDRAAFGAALKKLYPKNFTDNPHRICEFLSDMAIIFPVSRTADLMSKYTNVYFYQMSYYGPLGGRDRIWKKSNIVLTKEAEGKVAHTEELPYLYHYRTTSEDLKEITSSDKITSNRLVTLWSNFIKYLNPTPEIDPLLQNVRWPALKPDNFQYLDINHTLTVHNRSPRIYDEWKKLIEKYAQHPLATV